MENADEENTVECSIISVLEDIFSIIVTTQIQGANPDNSRSYIRYELSKEKWSRLDGRKTLYLKMPKDELLLLS